MTGRERPGNSNFFRRVILGIEHWLRWSLIAKCMATRISQAAASIPLIGYALLWSDSFDLLRLKPQLGLGLWFSSTDRLMLLYFGSIMLTLGWLLYLWKCPAIIRRAPDIEDHVLAEMQADNPLSRESSRSAIRSLLLNDASTGWLWKDETPQLLKRGVPAKLAGISVGDQHQPNSKSVLARCQYLMSETSNPTAFLICAAIVFVGLAGVLAPSLEVFLLVILKVVLPKVSFT